MTASSYPKNVVGVAPYPTKSEDKNAGKALRNDGRRLVFWLLLVLGVVYVNFFGGLTSIGLVGPDEPRYAAIAREMATGRDWVTPRLHGDPWLEKPVLYYWSSAVAYRLLGDSEAAARLPSSLAALLLTGVLAALAFGFYGATTAAVVAVVFPTTVGALGFARAATPDMLFAAALTLAMATSAALLLPAHAKSVRSLQISFGASLGLAVLAKGPAGIVLAAGSLMLWAIITRSGGRLATATGPWILLSGAVVALPWYVLCALRNPEFVRVFLLSHNVERFLTPTFRHEQPWWFFGPVLALGLAPWTPWLAMVAQDGLARLRGPRWESSPAVFMGCWATFPLVFFSASQSKLPGYILPVLPAVALLLARTLARRLETADGQIRWPFVGTASMLGAMAAIPLVPIAGLASVPGFEPEALRPLALTAGGGSLVAIYLGCRRQAHACVMVTVFTIGVACSQLNTMVLPTLDPLISPRTTAHRISALVARDDKAVEVYALHRAWHYGLNYYLHRRLPELRQTDPLPPVVVTTDRGVRALQADGVDAQVVERISEAAVIVTVGQETPPRGRSAVD